MNLSNEQKLLAMLLLDVHEKMDIKNGMDSKLIKEAIWSNQEWAIEWRHSGVFLEEDTPQHVRHVVDVLDMWSFLEEAYADMSAEEKARLKDAAEPFGTHVKWPGFDGNNEGEYMSAARLLIDHLDRFTSFAGRGSLNSHSPTIRSSERMLAVFEPIRRRLGEEHRGLTVDEVAAVLRARAA